MRRVAAIGLVLTLGCTTDMTSFEAGDAGSSRGVLIAGEATTFKTAAVAKMIEKLGTQEWHFRVIGLDELESHDTEGYGAILLVTAFKAGENRRPREPLPVQRFHRPAAPRVLHARHGGPDAGAEQAGHTSGCRKLSFPG